MRTLFVLLSLAILIRGAYCLPFGAGQLSANERQLLAITREAETLRTIRLLALTPEQHAALLPILTEQSHEMMAIREARIAVQPACEAAVRKQRDAALANDEVSDELTRAVNAARAPYEQLEETLNTTAIRRANAVWAFLTTAQGMQLRRLSIARGVTNAELKASIIRMLDPESRSAEYALQRIYTYAGLRDVEVKRAIQHGLPIFDAWLQLEEPERTQQAATVAENLLALPDTGMLGHTCDTPTQQFLLDNLLTLDALRFCNPGTPRQSTGPVESPTLQSLETDIQIMHLLNILYLSPDQIRQLIVINTAGQADIKMITDKREKIAAQKLPLMMAVRDAYASGKEPEPVTIDRLMALDEAEKSVEKDDVDFCVKYLEQLQSVLTDKQLVIASAFVANPFCRVPIKGDAELERALARMRSLPESQLTEPTQRLQGTIAKSWAKKRYPQERIDLAIAMAPSIISRARAMNDGLFKTKQSELAAQLAAPARKYNGVTYDNRVVNYLLSPNLPSLIR